MWKRIVLALGFVGSFLAGTQIPTAAPEEKPSVYYMVGYMKVEPGKEAEYIKMEREVWKPVHREYIKMGKEKAWYVYSVKPLHDTPLNYNFVTFNVLNQPPDDSYSDIEQVLAKVHPGRESSEFFQQTNQVRKYVAGEAWELLDKAE